ncbi:MAG: hypothetical protein QXS54_04790, partial [Candidatus Methanomethylicaceae archaeon]
MITSSSRTIAEQQDSRNLNHWRAFDTLKDLLGERPLVLDREFSYLEGLRYLVEAQVQVHFVIRLNLGSHPPKFWDAEGREVHLEVGQGEGETVIHREVRYKDEVCVNLIGTWTTGCAEPLWVMTDLAPEHGLQVYRARTKIEEGFRDLKGLLGMGRVMNKRQDYMEKTLALLLLVYAIGLLVGESLRDALYGQPVAHPPSADASTSQ